MCPKSLPAAKQDHICPKRRCCAISDQKRNCPTLFRAPERHVNPSNTLPAMPHNVRAMMSNGSFSSVGCAPNFIYQTLHLPTATCSAATNPINLKISYAPSLRLPTPPTLLSSRGCHIPPSKRCFSPLFDMAAGYPNSGPRAERGRCSYKTSHPGMRKEEGDEQGRSELVAEVRFHCTAFSPTDPNMD